MFEQAFPERNLTVILFKDVTNAGEIHAKLLDRSLEPELASRCRNALASNEGRPSRMQSDVVSALRALALPVREELVTAQGYSLKHRIAYDDCTTQWHKIEQDEADGLLRWLG